MLKSELYDLLASFGVFFVKPPERDRILAYVETLKGFTKEEITAALESLRFEVSYFPSLKEIYDRIRPPIDKKDLSVYLSGKIIEAISNFSYTEAKSVKEYLGPEAGLVIDRAGGFATICKVTYNDLGTLRAQLRDLARAVLEKTPETRLREIALKEEIEIETARDIYLENLEDKKLLTN